MDNTSKYNEQKISGQCYNIFEICCIEMIMVTIQYTGICQHTMVIVLLYQSMTKQRKLVDFLKEKRFYC